MAELTAAQLEDFRADIGDTGTAVAFTDYELHRLYARGGTYNAAVLAAFDQLLGNAVKFADYTANQSEEKRSQIFTNLLKLRGVWASKVAADTAAVGQQVRAVGLKSIPPRKRILPRS